MADSARITTKSALRLVVLLGVVSLFADMTYEGGRSITGPFLGVLGAGAAVVGVVAGFGELVGYLLRLASGYLTDRVGRYWAITFIGYAVNLLAVPLMALAGHWEAAAALIIAERLGKAARSPARDVILSHATSAVGRGWGFGLHEALDQVGAVLGPLIISTVLYLGGSYNQGFAALLVPALVALAVLATAWRCYPRPEELEPAAPGRTPERLGRPFWLYLAGVAFVAAGFADFPLIAFHFGRTASVPVVWIPMFYSAAMGADAIAALVFGRLYDRVGLGVLVLAAGLSALVAPLVFLGGFWAALAGMALWGMSMGAQESVMRAAVAGMAPAGRRGTAYGIFNAVFGLAWFLGSAALGLLYDRSLPALVGFCCAMSVLACPWLILASRRVADHRTR